ncbi:hypothetical protein OG818_23605 [Streptomyces virginiae]|uniref:hypothetical protein n=1 Tax=Streptomyces virginiae TaxID=1961 RepID=UPI00224CA3FD|nr:hypothetical protein [Streptomyces virginiae]MCX4718738.1 hypothetical protein [Streptomyces virginiae]
MVVEDQFRTVQRLELDVDALSLSHLGWRIDEVEACLVTTTYTEWEHHQEIELAGIARFTGEDWSDRFGGGDYAPALLLAVGRTDAPVAPLYKRLVMEAATKVSEQPQQLFERSSSWECESPLPPEEITLRITAVDVEEIESEFDLAPEKHSVLPVEVIDQSTQTGAVRLTVTTSSAHLLHDPYDTRLRVHLAGSAVFGAREQLLAAHLTVHDWRDQDATLEDQCPFDVSLPGLVVEAVGEEGTLLREMEISLYGSIPVGEAGELPARQPRWLADAGYDLPYPARPPARVIVRIVDADDL